MDEAKRPEKKIDTLITSDENRSMFDRIAGYYDGTNRILSLGFDRGWRRKAVACLKPEADGVYLDIGCGTADVCFEVIRQGPGSRVVGIDPSEGMLEIGRDKLEAAGLSEAVQLQTGDVLDLQFDDNSLDGAITAFCIRNVVDRRGALKEVQRVLRPGARLVILELTDPVGVMKPLFRVYSNVLIPLVTKIMSSVPAYRYLTKSMAHFPSSEEFTALIQETGYVNAQFFRMTGGITTIFVAEAPDS
ncbi:ubiquinone/menaquinone biosynthesis methyltransferase [Thermodesulfobacteriota bacterium]